MRISVAIFMVVQLFASGPALGQQLSTTEQTDLLYSREEEKLARDVYQYLYNQWQLPIFSNIASSEQRHMDAVLSLLNLYGLQDPVGDNGAGIFTDNTLQAFYDELTAQGSASIIAALEAGIYIEELDISDLETFIGYTDQAPLLRVYNNLLKGSNNHLAAFVNTLEAQGGNYPGGSQSGSSKEPGTAVYDPISQSIYIPALDVDSGNGSIQVYDGLLTIVETLPLTLRAVAASSTSRLPNPSLHASFDAVSGELTIQDLQVGSLVLDDVNNTHYTMVLQLDMSDVDAALFSVVSFTAK